MLKENVFKAKEGRKCTGLRNNYWRMFSWNRLRALRLPLASYHNVVHFIFSNYHLLISRLKNHPAANSTEKHKKTIPVPFTANFQLWNVYMNQKVIRWNICQRVRLMFSMITSLDFCTYAVDICRMFIPRHYCLKWSKTPAMLRTSISATSQLQGARKQPISIIMHRVRP